MIILTHSTDVNRPSRGQSYGLKFEPLNRGLRPEFLRLLYDNPDCDRLSEIVNVLYVLIKSYEDLNIR